MRREREGRWEIFITTGSKGYTDTDVPLKVIVFGFKGTSDAMILGEDVKDSGN